MPATNLIAGIAVLVTVTNFNHATFEPIPCAVCGKAHHYRAVENFSVVRSNEVTFVIDGKEMKFLVPAPPLLTAMPGRTGYIKATNLIEHPAVYRIPGAPRDPKIPEPMNPPLPEDTSRLPRRANMPEPPTVQQLDVPGRPK